MTRGSRRSTGESDLAERGADTYDENMEARLIKIESELAALNGEFTRVKTDIAVMRSNYATKEDLHKELHAMTWRIYGFAGGLVAAVYFIARYVH